MANHSTARWEAFQYALVDSMNKPEFKYKPSPTLEKFMKYTDILIPASEKERVLGTKQTDQDTVYLNILNKQSISTGSARAYNHSGSKNDSTRVEASFSTISAGFTYSLKESDRVFWNQAQMVAAQLRSAIIAIHSSIETDLLATLNTNKSQVVQSSTPKSGSWDSTNYIFQVLNADYDYFLQKLKGFMREQYYKNPPYEVIFDELLYQKAEQIISQGPGNSENLAWQGMGVDALASQELSADDGYLGMGYSFTPGSIGILPWIPKLNRQGFGDTFSNGGFYYNIPDPMGTGLVFAIHEYASGADNDGTSGETQDVDIEVEVSVDYAPVIAPMSTSNESPVYKFGVLQ